MDKLILQNGLSISYYQLPMTHSICIGLYVKVGSVMETVENNGVSHLLEHLHFRRLGALSQNELYDMTDGLGTTLCAETGQEYTRYYLKVRPEYFINCLQLFVDIMTFVGWTDEEFMAERNVVFDEKLGCASNSIYNSTLRSMLWGAHPLSLAVIGTEQSLLSLSKQDVIDHKKRYYTANNMALVITGNIDDYAKSLVNNLFSRVPLETTSCSYFKLGYSPIVCKRKPDVLLLSDETEMIDVCLCFDVLASVNPEALTLLNSILGGGTTSLLQRNIREYLGVSSDIYSEIECHCDTSLIKITFSTRAESVALILEQLVKTLDYTKVALSDIDISKNIRFYTDNLLFWLDDPEFLNFYTAWELHIMRNSFKDIDDLSSKFSRVTVTDLKKLATEVFQPHKASILLYGKLSTLDESCITMILNKLR